MILAEITAAVDDAGTTETFYLSSVPYSTSPTDTPPNRNFVPALTDPASLGVSVYANGRTGGYGELSVGQLKIANADRRYDAFLTHGFDGRAIVLRLYQPGVPYASMPILFTGTSDGPAEVSRQDVVIRLRDKQQVLAEALACPGVYGGTNVLPAGVDGGPDLKGKRKPRVYGRVFNVEPECVNTSKLIFQVHDGALADIPAVYDRGSSITKGADVATNALLQAAAITPGTYQTCLAEGLFRINAAPQGLITCDATQGANAAARTVGQLVKQIVTTAGVGADLALSEVTALDAINSAEVGIHLKEEDTSREAISALVESIGGYAIYDPEGHLRLGVLTDPAGADPDLTLTDSQVQDIGRQAQSDGDLPLYEVVIRHTRNWTVQDSDLAGTVSMERRAFLKEEWRRTAPAAIVPVRPKHLLAPRMDFDTLIVDEANAANGPADQEAKRLQVLHGVHRDMFVVRVHIDVLRNMGVPGLMRTIRLQTPRFLLSAGRSFRVIGFGLELRRKQATFTIWG